MNINELSVDELYSLRSEITQRINHIQTTNLLIRLEKNQIFSKYKYYFFDIDNQRVVGFGSENEGYIDDHVPEEISDDYHDLTSALGLMECMTCTYDFNQSRETDIENSLIAVGMTEGTPEWTE